MESWRIDAAGSNLADPSRPSVDKEFAHEKDSLQKQLACLEEQIKQTEAEIQRHSEMPANICVKLRALRKLQLQIIEKEAEFHHMAFKIETEFQNEFKNYHEGIFRIVNGLECPELLLAESTGSANDVADQSKGVPDFWLTVLKNSFLEELVQKADEPALKALTDVQCVLNNVTEPTFVLEFHFASNEYFTNKVLTKQYFLRGSPDPDDPATFNGFEIYRCTGCTIDWKPGQNLNEKTVTSDTDDAPSCTVTNLSFFNFFITEKRISDDCEPDCSLAMLECDFHYGYYIKETVIPRAVFLFLGEKVTVADNYGNCHCDRCFLHQNWPEVEEISSDSEENRE